MKKIISALLLSAVAGSAYAADEGVYVALNAGQSSTNTYNLSGKTATCVSGLPGIG